MNNMSQTGGVPDLITKLSDAQRECLRLVNAHLTSKEIAIQLGVSHHTVNQRIERACRTLGVPTRKDAARLLAIYDPLIYEPLDLAVNTTEPPSFPDLDYTESSKDDPEHYTFQDTATLPVADMQFITLPFPRKRGETNALTIKQRLIWAALIGGAGILISALLITALETLGRVI